VPRGGWEIDLCSQHFIFVAGGGGGIRGPSGWVDGSQIESRHGGKKQYLPAMGALPAHI
jgi:hypothetical protein